MAVTSWKSCSFTPSHRPLRRAVKGRGVRRRRRACRVLAPRAGARARRSGRGARRARAARPQPPPELAQALLLAVEPVTSAQDLTLAVRERRQQREQLLDLER